VPAKRKINDQELALLLARGMSQQKAADELGVSRVAVSKRIKWLKENNPMALQMVSVAKFRELESDMIAEVRQSLLSEMIRRTKAPGALNRESLPQLGRIFGILWDKDEKIQEKLSIQRVAHLHRHELDDQSKKMIQDVIDHMTQTAITQAQEDVVEITVDSGDSEITETPLLPEET
jgi:predicted transcriptional regulator